MHQHPKTRCCEHILEASNVFDVGNQSRQHDLQLKKHWISADGYFHIATTFFGITITDAWCSYWFHIHPNHRHYDIALEQFASLVASDMLANTHSSTPVVPKTFSLLMDNHIPQQIRFNNEQVAALSTLGNNQDNNLQLLREVGENIATHNLKCTAEFISYTVKENNGNVGKRARCNRCYECGNKTPFFSQGCPAPAGCKQL